MDPHVSVDDSQCLNIGFNPDDATASDLPTGKSESTPCSESGFKYEEVSAKEVQLALEYAELEVRAADTIQRAAEAKKLALDAIRKSKSVVTSEINGVSRRSLDSVVCTNLPAKAVVGSTSLNLTEGLNAKQDHANHVDFHASNYLLERLFAKLELPRCEMPFFDGSSVRYVMFFR